MGFVRACNLSMRGTHLSGGGGGEGVGEGWGRGLITAIYRHGAHHHRMGTWTESPSQVMDARGEGWVRDRMWVCTGWVGDGEG